MSRGIGIAALLAVTSPALSAQAGSRNTEDQCFGFSFGTWKPALNWTQAGHGAPVDASAVPTAPQGRGWAVSDSAAAPENNLVIFPVWWPAGVSITFDRMPRALTDTVTGTAMALVADGRKASPRAPVRAWQTDCRR